MTPDSNDELKQRLAEATWKSQRLSLEIETKKRYPTYQKGFLDGFSACEEHVVAPLKEALEKAVKSLEAIKNSDRKISGMSSTSGASETYWIYGSSGAFARTALAEIEKVRKE